MTKRKSKPKASSEGHGESQSLLPIKTLDLQKEMLYALIPGVVWLICDVAIQFIFPSLDVRYVELISGSFLIILLLSFRKPLIELIKHKLSYLLVIGFTIYLFFVLSNYLFYAYAERRTAYFLIDASSQMKGIIENIAPNIKLKAESLPSRLDVGLAVYGSGLSGKLTCNDVTEIIAPENRDEIITRVGSLSEEIRKLQPQGHAGLQEAIQNLIPKLGGKRGSHIIIVITSGVDSHCEELSREIIDKLAKSAGVQFEISVIPVGNISESDLYKLQAFSQTPPVVFERPEQLPEKINAILFNPPSRYWYSYFGGRQ